MMTGDESDPILLKCNQSNVCYVLTNACLLHHAYFPVRVKGGMSLRAEWHNYARYDLREK